MKIAIGSDHGAFALKNKFVAHLEAQGHEVKDFGTYSLDSCDYPDFGAAAAKAVASGECEKGIVLCTTGIGISISANKVKGVRCALLSDIMSARLTRLHNDTNMMAVGAAVVGEMLLWKFWIPGWAPSSPAMQDTREESTRSWRWKNNGKKSLRDFPPDFCSLLRA